MQVGRGQAVGRCKVRGKGEGGVGVGAWGQEGMGREVRAVKLKVVEGEGHGRWGVSRQVVKQQVGKWQGWHARCLGMNI